MVKKRILDVQAAAGKKITLSDYTHIRAYHATRSEDDNIFRNEGLRPYTKEEALNIAFRKLEGNTLDRCTIEEKFNELWDDTMVRLPPRVWLMLDTKELLSTSSHYLIYGSEFINSVAMHLGCREKLKDFGRPVIVMCTVPISDISPVWLESLECDIFHKNTAHCAIAVPLVLPSNVIDVQHPTGYVRDPYSFLRYRLG